MEYISESLGTHIYVLCLVPKQRETSLSVLAVIELFIPTDSTQKTLVNLNFIDIIPSMKGPAISLAASNSAFLFSSALQPSLYGASFCTFDKFFNETANGCRNCPLRNSYSIDFQATQCINCADLALTSLTDFQKEKMKAICYIQNPDIQKIFTTTPDLT